MIAAAAAIVGVALVAFVAVKVFDKGPVASKPACTGSLPVNVAVAPEIEAPVRAIAKQLTDDRVAVKGQCVSYQVKGVSTIDTFNQLANGDEDAVTPDLWVPDSSQWMERTGILGDRVLPMKASVAVSPLVLVGTKAEAAKLRPKASSWASVAAKGPVAFSDPEKSMTSLMALLGVRRSIAGDRVLAREEVGRTIISRARERVEDTAVELGRAPTGLTHVVPASEQQYLKAAKANPDADLDAVVPAGGTVEFDYPMYAVMLGKSEVDPAIEAGQALLRYVDSSAGKKIVHNAGFRDAADKAQPDPRAVKVPRVLGQVLPLDADDILRTWAAVTLEPKLLTVVDVSGTMGQPAAGGAKRIDLARDAAKAAVGYYPDSAEVGLWTFSQDLGPNGLDYKELTPIAPLTSGHRSAVEKALNSLPSQVGRNTGLFDTVLAAYRSSQGKFDSRRFNTMVLLTDGKDDNVSTLSLGQVLSELRTSVDDARPIHVILVGLGPDADLSVLRQLADAMRGQAFKAQDPKDMQNIVIDALLSRECRGVCR